jgi:hypothetical protein
VDGCGGVGGLLHPRVGQMGAVCLQAALSARLQIKTIAVPRQAKGHH